MNSRGHLRTPIILWVVVSIALAALYLFLSPILAQAGAYPTAASDVADSQVYIMQVFTLLSIPVFVGVVVFAAYSIFAFRSRGRPTEIGPQVHGNSKLLAWWLIASFVLVTILYVIGFDGLAQLEAAAPASALHVRVTAQQWIFNYTYTDYNIQSSTLYLELNQPVEFTVTSLDVHHSFWIPEMGVKADAVPGELNTFVATPNKLGHYTVRCMELCGVLHSDMNTNVIVLTPTDFGTWISQQMGAQPAGATAAAQMPEAALLGASGKRS
ncbi:MAG TPA: cytochrome c oxidase subunit II [Ktedonobacterales bacterium]|nr:cytochrome c oxidase subunit II [Ktedonobacterales bacterium]